MDEPLWSNERISQYAGNSPTAMEARRMFDAMVKVRDDYEARLAELEADNHRLSQRIAQLEGEPNETGY